MGNAEAIMITSGLWILGVVTLLLAGGLTMLEIPDEPLTGRVIDTNVSNDTEPTEPGVAPLSAGRLTRVDIIAP